MALFRALAASKTVFYTARNVQVRFKYKCPVLRTGGLRSKRGLARTLLFSPVGLQGRPPRLLGPTGADTTAVVGQTTRPLQRGWMGLFRNKGTPTNPLAYLSVPKKKEFIIGLQCRVQVGVVEKAGRSGFGTP